MRCSLTLGLLLVLGIGLPLGQARAGDESKTHTGQTQTTHFDIYVRPGSRAAASADHWASLSERFYARIAKQLEFKPPKRLRLFLYDSVAELISITGHKAAGFSTTRTSHIPYDNEQTARHELVHLFAEQLPSTGAERRDLFHVEGLANALLEFVDGVHVHAVARHYLDSGRLPTLEAISKGEGLRGWMAKHPKLRAYDIAGSFMRYLLDTHGVAPLKRYYTGTPASGAFGAKEAALEQGWHEALKTYRLVPEVTTLLRKGDGEKATFTQYEKDPEKRLPADVRGSASEWTVLTAEALHPVDKKLWKREKGIVVGSQPGGSAWRVCEFGEKRYGDCVVMARFSIPEFCPAVQVRLGDGCQALFVTNGTFLYRGTEGVRGNPEFGNPGRGAVHVTLVRRGHAITIYVNGARAVHVANGDATPARVGVAFLNGTVHVDEVKVRDLGS